MEFQKMRQLTRDEVEELYSSYKVTETEEGFRVENLYLRDVPREIVLVLPKEMPVDGCGGFLNLARWVDDRYNMLASALYGPEGVPEIQNGLETGLRFVNLHKENEQFICQPEDPRKAEYVIVRVHWNQLTNVDSRAESLFEGENVVFSWRWEDVTRPRGVDFYILRLTEGCKSVQEMFAEAREVVIEFAQQLEEEFQQTAALYRQQFESLVPRVNAVGWYLDFQELAERGMVQLKVILRHGVEYYNYRYTEQGLQNLCCALARVETDFVNDRYLPEVKGSPARS